MGLRLAALGTALALLGGCSFVGAILDPSAPPETPRARPFSAYDLDESEARPGDAVVRVYLGGGVVCSGALIAPSIVLTARHCLLRDAKAPRLALEVALGGGPISWGWVGVRGATLCASADVALLVLARSVPRAVTPLPLDLAGPSPAEAVVVSGFGTGMRSFVLHGLGVATWQIRSARRGPVTRISAAHFDVAVASEQGDSGGPAVGAHGKLLGVISTVSDSATQIARIDACETELSQARALAME